HMPRGHTRPTPFPYTTLFRSPGGSRRKLTLHASRAGAGATTWASHSSWARAVPVRWPDQTTKAVGTTTAHTAPAASHAPRRHAGAPSRPSQRKATAIPDTAAAVARP